MGLVTWRLKRRQNGIQYYNKFNTDGTPINIYLAKVLTDGLKVGDTIQIYVEVSAGLEGSNIQMRLQGDGDVTGWGTGNFPISQWRTYTSAGGYVFKYSATVNENHIKNSFWTARLRVDGATSGWVRHRKFKVERGKVRTDWSPAVEDLATVTALHEVKDTVSSHTRTISALDGSVSQAIQTANGILSRVGTLESNVADKSSVSAVQNQVNQLAGSWAVQNLTSSGQILNQFNLLANGTNRIDGRLTHITGQTLIDNGVINNAMIGNLDAGKITTGYLASARIATNSITGSHMVFDQAFFNGLMANEAYLKQLFAKNAFITSVQAVAISASNVTTGILRATNGAMDVNLDNASMVFRQDAKIEFQSENNTLFRTRNGTSAFIHFRDDGYNGVYTAMGVNADNTGTQNDYSSGRFAGVRVIRTNPNRYSGTTIDQVQLIGDEIRMRHGYGYENDYLIVNYDGGPKINLMAWLRQFNTNFMHLVNITGRGDVIKTF
ncbi:gp58-like family protein [Streptococcus suis]|uniref:gp58-like family protein n=1 Tax=Streptococcus suis TaxID=1307 RepID=UPI00240D8746|nr:gp58-like family protein [Streptococcus suis]WFA76676.1 gp58-like family protein [Streptococcus suis]